MVFASWLILELLAFLVNRLNVVHALSSSFLVEPLHMHNHILKTSELAFFKYLSKELRNECNILSVDRGIHHKMTENCINALRTFVHAHFYS